MSRRFLLLLLLLVVGQVCGFTPKKANLNLNLLSSPSKFPSSLSKPKSSSSSSSSSFRPKVSSLLRPVTNNNFKALAELELSSSSSSPVDSSTDSTDSASVTSSTSVCLQVDLGFGLDILRVSIAIQGTVEVRSDGNVELSAMVSGGASLGVGAVGVGLHVRGHLKVTVSLRPKKNSLIATEQMLRETLEAWWIDEMGSFKKNRETGNIAKMIRYRKLVEDQYPADPTGRKKLLEGFNKKHKSFIKALKAKFPLPHPQVYTKEQWLIAVEKIFRATFLWKPDEAHSSWSNINEYPKCSAETTTTPPKKLDTVSLLMCRIFKTGFLLEECKQTLFHTGYKEGQEHCKEEGWFHKGTARNFGPMLKLFYPELFKEKPAETIKMLDKLKKGFGNDDDDDDTIMWKCHEQYSWLSYPSDKLKNLMETKANLKPTVIKKIEKYEFTGKIELAAIGDDGWLCGPAEWLIPGIQIGSAKKWTWGPDMPSKEETTYVITVTMGNYFSVTLTLQQPRWGSFHFHEFEMNLRFPFSEEAAKALVSSQEDGFPEAAQWQASLDHIKLCLGQMPTTSSTSSAYSNWLTDSLEGLIGKLPVSVEKDLGKIAGSAVGVAGARELGLLVLSKTLPKILGFGAKADYLTLGGFDVIRAKDGTIEFKVVHETQMGVSVEAGLSGAVASVGVGVYQSSAVLVDVGGGDIDKALKKMKGIIQENKPSIFKRLKGASPATAAIQVSEGAW